MITKNQIKLIKQLEQKKFRRREGLFVAEGPKVVGDLMKRWEPVAVYATDDYSPTTTVNNLQRISSEELRKVSFLQHPQQVLALFPLPKDATSESSSRPFASGISASGQTIFADSASKDSPLVLALDGVQDPGNLGTIIRLVWYRHYYLQRGNCRCLEPKSCSSNNGKHCPCQHFLYQSS